MKEIGIKLYEMIGSMGGSGEHSVAAKSRRARGPKTVKFNDRMNPFMEIVRVAFAGSGFESLELNLLARLSMTIDPRFTYALCADLAEDADFESRKDAVDVLVELSAHLKEDEELFQRVRATLKKLTEDAEVKIRRSATVALEKLSARPEEDTPAFTSVITSLKARAKDPEKEVRQSAAEAMGNLSAHLEGDEKRDACQSALTTLKILARSKEEYEREEAVKALGDVSAHSKGDTHVLRSVLGTFERLAYDDTDYVRRVVAEVLGNVSAQLEGNKKLLRSARAILEILTKDPEEHVRLAAAETLVTLSVHLEEGDKRDTRQTALTTIEILLKDPDKYARSSAAMTLGKLSVQLRGEKETLRLLRELMKGLRGEVRKAFFNSLAWEFAFLAEKPPEACAWIAEMLSPCIRRYYELMPMNADSAIRFMHPASSTDVESSHRARTTRDEIERDAIHYFAMAGQVVGTQRYLASGSRTRTPETTLNKRSADLLREAQRITSVEKDRIFERQKDGVTVVKIHADSDKHSNTTYAGIPHEVSPLMERDRIFRHWTEAKRTLRSIVRTGVLRAGDATFTRYLGGGHCRIVGYYHELEGVFFTLPMYSAANSAVMNDSEVVHYVDFKLLAGIAALEVYGDWVLLIPAPPGTKIPVQIVGSSL